MLKLKLYCRSPDIEDPNDRVEVAFRRLDSDGDGYLHLEDFVQLGWPLVRAEVGQDQLQRIFRGCDQTGDGRVSLQVTAAPGSCLLCPHVWLCIRSSASWPRVTVTSPWRACSTEATAAGTVVHSTG